MNKIDKNVFFGFYANLPLNIRKEIVLDLKDKGGPITWEVASREISANTKLGDEIFQKLIELDFIPKE